MLWVVTSKCERHSMALVTLTSPIGTVIRFFFKESHSSTLRCGSGKHQSEI